MICSWGFLLDLALRLDVQVVAVTRGAYYQLWRMPFLNRKDLAMVTCSCPSSIISIFYTWPLKPVWELVSKAFFREIALSPPPLFLSYAVMLIDRFLLAIS